MKYKYSIFTSALLLGVSIVTSGCSGGGSSSGSGDTPPTATTATTAVTSVSGTTGSGTSTTSSTAIFSSAVPTTQQDYGTATLIVDSDGNGVLESSDTTYIVGIESDGSFSFDNVGVDEENEVKAQLTVEKEGYAPVVRTLTLSKDNPLSVLAKIGNIPVLTEVQTLPATAAERASSFLKFGITKSSTGVTSFSKLMTLSELRAEAKVSLGADTLSESVIPAAAFDSSVTTVTAKMQAFDSTKAEDIALFPGEFAGHGKSQVSASATTDTTDYPLESAAFDMIKLTDQNGDEITLQPITTSKFTSMATSADTCNGMFWTRRVTSEQAAVIEAWGDDDNDSSNGFQVPIWSNDNSTGSWEYLGLGDWNASTSSFSTCVDKKWQGYLNCDSQISFDKPKEICVAAVDQDGNPLGSISVQAKKGNSYSYQYLDGEGKGKLALTAGTPDEWEFTYDGSITGWSPVAIDSTTVTSSTTTGCDYDMSFTVDNPYSAKVYVYALDDNGKPIASAYVSLKSTNYSDYYSKSARTNAQGYAEFSVKPNVVYTAKYKAGTSAVNVNGTVADPETADSGKYASVSVKDQNAVPSVYVYTYQNRIKDTAQSLNFHVSASDANDDTLTLSSLTVNGTALTAGRDYIVERTSSYAGGYYLYGKLDLNSSTMSGITSASLSAGNYTISAVLSDGKTTGDDSTNFSVTANSAPTIGSVYLVDSSWNYYYENSVIPTGTYTVNAYIYDLDGDNVNKTISVDGVETASSVTLAQGDHNITINADDGNLSATKTISIYVGNHPPVITSAGATKFRVDVNAGEKFKLYAYAEDADRNSITVTAQDAAGNSYTLTRAFSYTTKYVSKEITLTNDNVGDNSFTIVANDGEANSTLATVSVEAYAEDQKPIFTKELTSQNVNVNTSTTFECVAKDPEGTPVSYSWSLNGTAVATGTTYTNTFTKTGSNTLSCTATDAAGKTATSSATITVVDPTQTGTLTIHTGVENLKVSIHDVTTALVTQEKNTDANGDATFSIVGDRTTVSLTTWPGMEIGSGLLMSL
ncbi:MAG: hypothetical protein IE887_08755, partial [Campylobacterales bacterium]|nr:hypothetical protein [Campylobacterales bacterium]